MKSILVLTVATALLCLGGVAEAAYITPIDALSKAPPPIPVTIMGSVTSASPGTLSGVGVKQYNIIDLGTVPGCAYSFAWAINDYGQIVGDSTRLPGPYGDPPGWMHACLWQNGTATAADLGVLGGGISRVYAINNSGQIVGFSTIDDDNIFVRACLWQSGAITDLGGFDGSNYNIAYDINDQSQIVGVSSKGYGPDGPAWGSACLWQNGTVTDLDMPGGCGGLPHCSNGLAAYAINNSGQIVGVWGAGGLGPSACLWQNNGTGYTITDLIPTDFGSYAYDINDNGQIVVWYDPVVCLWQNGTLTIVDGTHSYFPYQHINNNGQIVGSYGHACLLQNGTFTDLGVLPGYSGSAALGINNQGQIVGYSWMTDGSGKTRACLWDPIIGNFPVVATTGKSVLHPIMTAACNGYSFLLCGKATVVDSTSLDIDDGSGVVVRVIAPGYSGISSGDSITATGTLSPSSSPPTLTCDAGKVQKLK